MTIFNKGSLWLLCLTLILTGCADSNPDAPPPGQAHPSGWVNAHETTTSSQLDGCRSCHANDLHGTDELPGCYDCHFGPAGDKMPPGSTVSHGSLSHSTLESSAGLVCNRCHELMRQAQQGPDNCHDCHIEANHPLGQPWLDSKVAGYHGTVAQTALDSCKPCHGDDLTGGASSVSCSGCHFGPTGSKIPAGVIWTHGTVPHETLTDSNPVCESCHTVSRLYGNGPTTCHDCHDSHAVPYPGALHRSASTAECFGCHPANLAGSSYPALTGAPNCRGCHLDANPSTDPSCSDCHGSTTNDTAGTLMAGRPVGGSSFPNRSGEHNRSEHRSRACTVCHPFTSGDTRHGWSNGEKSTAAQINTTTLNWNATDKTCNPSCHGTENWY